MYFLRGNISFTCIINFVLRAQFATLQAVRRKLTPARVPSPSTSATWTSTSRQRTTRGGMATATWTGTAWRLIRASSRTGAQRAALVSGLPTTSVMRNASTVSTRQYSSVSDCACVRACVRACVCVCVCVNQSVFSFMSVHIEVILAPLPPQPDPLPPPNFFYTYY